MNFLEIFNEIAILFVGYTLFYFTDFVSNPVLKHEIGWVLIVFTLLNITCNILLVLLELFKVLKVATMKLINRLKKKYDNEKLKKYNETDKNL